MELYIFIYILLLISSRLFGNRRIVVALFLLFFAFMIGFRGESVGSDTMTNMSLYMYELADGYNGHPEPFYGILGAYCNQYGLSFPVFQTLIMIFALSFVYIEIVKQSPNYNMSVFLLFTMYYVFYAMNIYREMIACFIFVFAFPFINGTQRWHKSKYIVIILLATGFHKSILFMLPALFVKKIKLSFSFIFTGFVISFSLGLVDVVGKIASLISMYAPLLEQDDYARNGNRLFLGILLMLYWMIGFAYLYTKSDKEMKESVYLKLFFCGIMVYNIFLKNDMGIRMMLYFSIPLIIGIPVFIQNLKNRRIFNQTLIVSYCSIFFFVFLLANSADVVPYVLNIK